MYDVHMHAHGVHVHVRVYRVYMHVYDVMVDTFSSFFFHAVSQDRNSTNTSRIKVKKEMV